MRNPSSAKLSAFRTFTEERPKTSRRGELLARHPDFLTVPEVAELLRMTKKGVYVWINQGRIPAYKPASSWFVLRDDLRDFIASETNQGVAPQEGEDEA